MNAPKICGFCNAPAAWRWKPNKPPAAYSQFMCDDHAARIDLDELEELHPVKFYAKDITDVGGQIYAVHDGVHAGTVRIMPVGQPGREIVLDVTAAAQLRDALTGFLPSTGDPPTMIITFSGDIPAEFAERVIVALRKHNLR